MKKNILLSTSMVFALTVLSVQAENFKNIRVDSSIDTEFFANEARGGGALQNCDGIDLIYEQPFLPANFGSATTSDADVGITLRTSEGVVDDMGVLTTLPAGLSIDTLRFWTLSLEFNAGFIGPCAEDDATGYVVTVFENNAGVPGVELGSSTAQVVSNIDTAIPFALGANVFETTISLDTPISTDGVVHIGLQREAGQATVNGTQCLALWVNEADATTFDNVTNQFNTKTGTNTVVDADHPICVGGANPDIIFENGFES